MRDPRPIATLAVGALLCLGAGPTSRPSPAPSASGVGMAAGTGHPRVIALGDSLTEGYGVARGQAWPERLEAELRRGGFPGAVVVNAGSSGSTSSGAAARLRWQLLPRPGAVVERPDLVILALGANDGLRGLAPKTMERNLDEALALARSAGVPVLLAGMKLPPNYGAAVAREFEAVFPRLAQRHGAALIPFLLEGVAGVKALNQPDGIHPTAEGHRRVFELVLPHVRRALGAGKRGG